MLLSRTPREPALSAPPRAPQSLPDDAADEDEDDLDYVCPLCKSTTETPEDLFPNEAMRRKVAKFRAGRADDKAAANAASDVVSNAVAAQVAKAKDMSAEDVAKAMFGVNQIGVMPRQAAAPSAGSGEVRPGDWICPTCGANVFASKRCAAPNSQAPPATACSPSDFSRVRSNPTTACPPRPSADSPLTAHRTPHTTQGVLQVRHSQASGANMDDDAACADAGGAAAA